MDEEKPDDAIISGEVLSYAQIMAIENGSRCFDMPQRFWKAWFVLELVCRCDDLQALKESAVTGHRRQQRRKEEIITAQPSPPWAPT